MNEFYKNEGVVALFDRGGNSDMSAGGSDLSWQTQRMDGGTVFIGSGGGRAAGSLVTVLPQVTLAVEHYNRMVRLLDHNVPVKVELNIEARFHDEVRRENVSGGAEQTAANRSTRSDPIQDNGFNIIGDFPGTDLAKEIVLIGGHFDSWHGATGATDNAAGVSAMMEVLRIFRAAGLKPRRTIRIALWGAEEQGLIGSRLYAEKYLGTREGAEARTRAPFRVLQYRQRHRQDSRHLDAEQRGRAPDLRGVDQAAQGPRRRDPRTPVGRAAPITRVSTTPASRASSSSRSDTNTTRARTTRTWISTIACRWRT